MAFRRTSSYVKTRMEPMHNTYTCEWIEEELMSDGKAGTTKNQDNETITSTSKRTNSKVS